MYFQKAFTDWGNLTETEGVPDGTRRQPSPILDATLKGGIRRKMQPEIDAGLDEEEDDEDEASEASPSLVFKLLQELALGIPTANKGGGSGPGSMAPPAPMAKLTLPTSPPSTPPSSPVVPTACPPPSTHTPLSPSSSALPLAPAAATAATRELPPPRILLANGDTYLRKLSKDTKLETALVEVRPPAPPSNSSAYGPHRVCQGSASAPSSLPEYSMPRELRSGSLTQCGDHVDLRAGGE